MSLFTNSIVIFRRKLVANLIGTREALPASEQQRLTAQIGAHVQTLLEELAPQSIGFYWPFRAEPDLREIIAQWLAADSSRRATLPVVEEQGRAMRFRQWSPQASLITDRYGIMVPAEGDWMTPDLLLIPFNGFDARGYRLGYGGGYFDRTLASIAPYPVTVGVGFELSRLDHIPEQPHDIPLQWVITEKGCFKAQG